MDDLINVTVAKKSEEAADIVSLELVPSVGSRLPEFSAGSHIDVHIKDGIIRQYSLCNSPDETHRYLLGVLKEPESKGGSIAIHNDINEGDKLTISKPRNSFHLIEDSPYSLLLGGGIGITPILCMAQRLYSLGQEFEMHYCTRSQDRTAFQEAINSSPFAERVHLHQDDGPDEQLLDIPRLLSERPDNANLYVCGPKGFMDFVIETAEQTWPVDSIHREYFSADPKAGHDDDTSFKIKIASTGNTYIVPPDKNIIDILADNGIDVPMSCEQGICGTCMVRVIEGIPEHRDSYQTAAEMEENVQMTVCCSRAISEEITLGL